MTDNAELKTLLPIIQSCTNCAACCMEQGSPPGFAAVIFSPKGWPQATGDHKRWESVPPEGKEIVLDYFGDKPSGCDGDPCCWLDQDTKQCRFYEWRPKVCRDFEMGSLECLEWRWIKGVAHPITGEMQAEFSAP